MSDKTKKIRNKNHEVIKNVMKIVITILFFGIQVLLYFTLFFGINFLKPDYPVVFRIIYGIVQWIGIICVLLMYRRKINNSYKLSWTIFILLCPFLGTMCYLMFGNGRVLSNKKRLKLNNYLNAYKIKKKEIKNLIEEKPDFARISRALYEDSKFPLYKNSHIEFFKDALDKHNDMLEELANAKHYIFMEYFIFGKGKIMNSLLDTLETKGKLGVEIKIMADDIGSILSRDKEIFNRLQNIPNLEFKSYEPLGLDINPRVNYRDHRKICVVDGRVAYTGGDNIADEYIHLRDRFGYWRDNAVKIKGEAVESFVAMFISMWYMCTNDKLDIKKYMLKDNEQIYSNSYVQPFGDGPMNKINPAYHLFMNMITSAKKSLFISTPYFIIF